MILYLTAGLFGGYNETIKFEELGISTHSLTRRLTGRLYNPWLLRIISTHSLTRRLTPGSPVDFMHILYFNSQPHKEADVGQNWQKPRLIDFNSQPHKEADLLSQARKPQPNYFNSQPHKEADVINAFFDSPPGIFQLTASQGGWQKLL